MTAEEQISRLGMIFARGEFSPVFKDNPKHPMQGIPRITYTDTMNYNFIIRCCAESVFESGSYWDGPADIVAQYDSIEALVNDGWELD